MYAEKQLIDKVEKITVDISAALNRMKSIPGMYDKAVIKDTTACKSIPRQIRSDIIKIAVVGAIKSGKSTFVNSWLKKDILKRGAGVVTSVITKVRKGETLRASVSLKSWDEINREVEKALLFFPDLESIAALHNISLKTNDNRFDLRRKNDRALLKSVKKLLCDANSVTETGIRQEAVMINQVLDGFETIKTMIQPESSTIVFLGDQFHEYKQFTGNDSLAFFVKNVTIDIEDANLAPLIEIADCQGSDSTNPAHMIHIQNYLISSSLIIYVISSRTGIRKADIKFLNIIKNMGLIDRLFFIVNVDFDEHGSIADLISVENRIKQDITYIKDDPTIFTISSLYNLLSSCLDSQLNSKDEKIESREKNRFDNWKQAPELIRYSDNMTQNFYSAINTKLSMDHELLLVANHVEHLRIILKNAYSKIDMFKNFLSDDLVKVNETTEKLKNMQQHARKFDSKIRNSLNIAVDGLKSDIEKAINDFFNTANSNICLNTVQFIKNYDFDYKQYESIFRQSGFNNTIYHMFHDFRTQFDTFMTEKFNSEVMGFINEQEQHINQCFTDMYSSNTVNPFKTLSGFKTFPDISLPSSGTDAKQSIHTDVFPDLKAVKGITGLTPPKTAFTAKYSARIKLDSMAGFCLHFVSEILNKIFKKKFKSSEYAGLHKAGTRIKKQTLRLVLLHINQYASELKTLYFFKLITALSRDLHDKLMDRFEMYDVEIEQVEQLVKADQWEKKNQMDTLESIKIFLNKIRSEMDSLMI